MAALAAPSAPTRLAMPAGRVRRPLRRLVCAEQRREGSRGPQPPNAQAASGARKKDAQPAPIKQQEPEPSQRPPISREEMGRTVRGVVLAGGATANPLTRHRAMPAVPLGSSLRMVDIPLNNCLQAGVNKIYVLTQFQSHTLNSHIASSYPPVNFGAPDQHAWVDVLAAQQTVTEREWYQGSADAVRKNVRDLKDEWRGITPAQDYIIMSGSAVYNMDFTALVAAHREKGADVTIAMHPVGEEMARSKGVAQVHPSSCKVMKFVERPTPEDLRTLQRDAAKEGPGREFLANMGIYVFRREALIRLLDRPQLVHIGHHVIPNALAQEMKVYAFQHDGYWHDVSSLKDFFETNLDLADPECTMGVEMMPSRVAANLPPALMHDVQLERVVVGDGSVLVGCKIKDSVLGQSSYVGRGSHVESSLLLGNGAWMSDSQRSAAAEAGERVYGVGENCFLRRCVVDENATIGSNVQIINKHGVQEADRAADSGFMIQDGIVVVMRNAIIPDGVVI